MNFLDSLTPSEFIILSDIVAFAIAKDKATQELGVIGNFVSQVGSNLLAIVAQQQFLESKEQKQKQIDDLRRQISALEKEL